MVVARFWSAKKVLFWWRLLFFYLSFEVNSNGYAWNKMNQFSLHFIMHSKRFQNWSSNMSYLSTAIVHHVHHFGLKFVSRIRFLTYFNSNHISSFNLPLVLYNRCTLSSEMFLLQMKFIGSRWLSLQRFFSYPLYDGNNWWHRTSFSDTIALLKYAW